MLHLFKATCYACSKIKIASLLLLLQTDIARHFDTVTFRQDK
jgi:hypothetical protein